MAWNSTKRNVSVFGDEEGQHTAFVKNCIVCTKKVAGIEIQEVLTNTGTYKRETKKRSEIGTDHQVSCLLCIGSGRVVAVMLVWAEIKKSA